MAIVDFNKGDFPPVHNTGKVAVSSRATWAGDWQAQQWLHCQEAIWSSAPTMPVAILEWDYGTIKRSNRAAFEVFDKILVNDRLYIRASFDTDDNTTRVWYGILEIAEDTQQGSRFRGNWVDSGNQTFVCYGLEKLLADEILDTTYFKDQRDGLVKFGEYAHPFNHKGRPNRTKEKPEALSYVFEPCEEKAEYWSSADILEYLLSYQIPRDKHGFKNIPFVIPDNILPGWDRPQIRQHGRSVYSLINEIADVKRSFLWWLEVAENKIQFKANTMTANQIVIDLPNANPIPANTAQKEVHASRDPLTASTVKDSLLYVYDQVVMRGRRRRSVGTFAIVDATLEAGWTVGEQTDYESGAADTVAMTQAIADGDIKKQQRLHSEARNRPELKKVFSYFRIPKSWNYKVRGGNLEDEQNFFTKDKFFGEMFLEQTLPLVEGVDYSGDQIRANLADELAEEERIERYPLVAILRPGGERWVLAEDVGQDAHLELTDDDENNLFSMSVEIPNRSRGFYLRVHGQPQHVIAGTGFTGLSVDEHSGSHMVTSGGMIATLAIEEDAFAEGLWPLVPNLAADYVRQKIIDAGDSYRRDYVVPDTVVDIDKEGTLVFTNGGVLPAEVPSDEKRLEQLAKIAFAWYGVKHSVLTLKSERLKPQSVLNIGDLVTDFGHAVKAGGHHATVNAPITQIRFTWKRGTPDSTDAPSMDVTTWAGELDALQLLPENVPTVSESMKRAREGLLPQDP